MECAVHKVSSMCRVYEVFDQQVCHRKNERLWHSRASSVHAFQLEANRAACLASPSERRDRKF